MNIKLCYKGSKIGEKISPNIICSDINIELSGKILSYNIDDRLGRIDTLGEIGIRYMLTDNIYYIPKTFDNGEIIKIENSCNFGNINVISSGISYSGTGGIIDLNQYSSTQIELNNSFSIGDIERKATYKANLIGNNNGRKNTSWLFI